tara:strand:+ start:565 stop:1200 length:636 start_codon:yes stop_codon:yes gene_type:complete
MYLHKYKDYEEYKSIQIKGNKAKLSYSWVDLSNLYKIAEYVLETNPEASFGLCHGTRRGLEQERIKEEFLNRGKDITVTGTEISDTAQQFKNTIQWDFHEVDPEWLGNVDFIYSNSLDHSYDPELCLDRWMSCINERGVCVLEWSGQHGKRTNGDTEELVGRTMPFTHRQLDPFVADIDEYKNLIKKKYDIVNIIENPKSTAFKSRYIFVK